MQVLINDLLAFSRVGGPRTSPPWTSTARSTDALASLEPALEEAEAVVTGDPLPEVQGDQTLLTQVFST